MPVEYAPNVPKVGRAALVRDKGPNYWIELVEDYPVPAPGPTEVLLRMNCTGLCQSDHHFMKSDWGFPMACDCSGHEGAGVVVGIGEAVSKGQWKLGDRAGLKPVHDVCHACEHCRNGNETVCDSGPYTGMAFNGSYCEYVTSPANYTARIPDGVPDEVAAPIMCSWVFGWPVIINSFMHSGSTVFAALGRANLRSGNFVVILGAGGGVGSMCVTVANGLGYRVVGIDTGDDKKQMVLDLGAEHFVDFLKSDKPVKEVMKLTGGGAHAVIACGGSAKSYEGATDYLRKLGTLVCVGLPPAGSMVASPIFSMATRKLTIAGSLVASLDEIENTFDLVARKKIKPYITVYPWKRFVEIQKKLASTQLVGRAVVRFNNDTEEARYHL